MPKAVILPKFGFNQETAEIVRWLVKEGQTVDQGDPLCEVTTDKINMEVEATASGVVAGLQFPEGATVPVTTVICYILAPGETPAAIPAAAPAPAASSPAPAPAPAAPPPSSAPAAVPATPLARRAAAVEGVDLSSLAGSGPGGRITKQDVLAAQSPALPGKVNATPAARRLAAESGIDLTTVRGSGPGGRIQSADLPAPRPAVSAAVSVPVPAGAAQAIPLAGVRKIIAERMQQSVQQIPHFLIYMDVDMTRAEALRQSLNPRYPEPRAKVSVTALIVKAIAGALRQFPLLNSHFVNDTIYQFNAVNVGVAVALEGGLIVPVIKDADQKSIFQIGDDLAEVSARARQNRLTPADIEGGTFTLSNLGMYGVDYFTAIINPPQVGILAAGRITRRFVPDENDQPVARSILTISLSADHRVIDGAAGAQFLAAVRTALENPNVLLEA